MSAASRSKGRKGQREASDVLRSLDWSVAELNAGTSSEDFIATDPNGRVWSIEIKNTVAITVEHRKQAQRQAKERRLPWMLMSHIEGTRSWLIQRSGVKPTVWHERDPQEYMQ
ncbi:hypothetical protein [Petrachloros mirabilis]